MEKIITDLAIVAAGPAGLCASVAAAEAGVQVAVFEKSSIAGGTANMGMGPFGVESRIQKRTMGTLRKEEAFRRFMDYVHWQSDANLVHDYIWNSGPTIDWLEDMGVRFAGAMKLPRLRGYLARGHARRRLPPRRTFRLCHEPRGVRAGAGAGREILLQHPGPEAAGRRQEGHRPYRQER